MTPLSDGLAEPDARIDFHVPNDRLINTMVLETISITICLPTILRNLRGTMKERNSHRRPTSPARWLFKGTLVLLLLVW